MLDELCALQNNGTWNLVPLPPGKSVVGFQWVFTIKVEPEGTVDWLKARLMAKGYIWIFKLDFGDMFSLVTKMASCQIILSHDCFQRWPLYQLDGKNVFLHAYLLEEIYMEQPTRFLARGSLLAYYVVITNLYMVLNRLS